MSFVIAACLCGHQCRPKRFQQFFGIVDLFKQLSVALHLLKCHPRHIPHCLTVPVGSGWKLCFQKQYREFWKEPDGRGSFSRVMVPDIVVAGDWAGEGVSFFST